MNKFYLLLLSFILLSAGSTSGHKSCSNTEIIFECPKCNEQFKSCVDEAGKVYAEAVESAADSIGSKTSKVNYRAACEEARKIKNKAISECTVEYNKCCLAETKAEMEKSKKEKEKQ